MVNYLRCPVRSKQINAITHQIRGKKLDQSYVPPLLNTPKTHYRYVFPNYENFVWKSMALRPERAGKWKWSRSQSAQGNRAPKPFIALHKSSEWVQWSSMKPISEKSTLNIHLSFAAHRLESTVYSKLASSLNDTKRYFSSNVEFFQSIFKPSHPHYATPHHTISSLEAECSQKSRSLANDTR